MGIEKEGKLIKNPEKGGLEVEISFLETENDISFITSEIPENLISVFKRQFYEVEGDLAVKKFPKPIENLETIKQNYLKYKPELISQAGNLKPVKWEEGLAAFIDIVSGEDIDWWLAGSCSLALRGIDVVPHDIDIMLSSRDLEKIKNHFLDYTLWPILPTGGWIVEYFGMVFLGCQVDFAFDPLPELDQPEPVDCGPYAGSHLEEIVWKGQQIKVPPVELFINVNRKRGRFDRVQAIENFLKIN